MTIFISRLAVQEGLHNRHHHQPSPAAQKLYFPSPCAHTVGSSLQVRMPGHMVLGGVGSKHCQRGSTTSTLPALLNAWTEIFGKSVP